MTESQAVEADAGPESAAPTNGLESLAGEPPGIAIAVDGAARQVVVLCHSEDGVHAHAFAPVDAVQIAMAIVEAANEVHPDLFAADPGAAEEAE